MTLEAHNLTITAKGTLANAYRGVPFMRIKETVLGKDYELSIAFVGPAQALALNRTHRNRRYIPNTLAFPLTKQSGEIVLCSAAMQKEFRSFGMDLRTYAIFLLIHSMLHLKGYAHGGTMERKEKELLALFA